MLHTRNEKWLPSCGLILHLVLTSGLQASASVQCTFEHKTIHRDQLQKICQEANNHRARINDTNCLEDEVIPDRKKYWTGHSWCLRSRKVGFLWYINLTFKTSVDDRILNMWNTWIWFLIEGRGTNPTLEIYNKTYSCFCEKANGELSPTHLHYTESHCKDLCEDECEKEVKCHSDLRARTTGTTFWIDLLSCDQQGTHARDDSSGSQNPGNKGWWLRFILRSNDTRLVARNCNEEHNYMCEQSTSNSRTISVPTPTQEIPSRATSYAGNSELVISLTKERQSLATAVTSSSSSSSCSSSSSSSPPSSSSLSLLSSLSLSSSWLSLPSASSTTATTTIKTAAEKLSQTSMISTVDLSNESSTPSISENTHAWLSVKTMTSPIVNSIAFSTPSPSMESSMGSNPMEKLQHKAIEKLKTLNVTYKDSLKNAVKTIQNLFEDLKDIDDVGKGTVNVLDSTQQLESFAFKYAKIHFKKKQSFIIMEENYGMTIQRLAANNTDPLVFSAANNTTQQFDKEWVGIELPSEVLKGKDIAIFIIYNDISQFVPKFPALELRNRIIAANVYPPPQDTLQENVKISFGRDKKEVGKYHCMFWNFTIKSAVNGTWSAKGCSLEKSDDNKIICTCNHLTNFAVLMQVGKNEVTSEHLLAMDIITYVGCALSLTAEVLTIIAYCTLTDFKQDQMQIRLNLVVALAAAQLAFLSGIDALEPKGLCVFVAALIHYFYLVGFAWMLFEGVYLYLMVVKVFNTEIRIRAFYSVAWGSPAGIVVLSIVLAACQEGGLHSYVHGAFCWVSFSNNLIWTFVAPVLLVCVTNAVLLSLVIREILKMQSDRASNVEKLRQAAKACVVLSPLLGMTWVFGILSVTNASVVFQYIFTIFNSLQGFFIFLLHILRNADVRAEFKRKKRMWLQMRGRVADLHSSDKWTSKAIRSDAFEFNEKHVISSSHLSSRNKNQIVPFQEPLPSVECN